MQVKKNRQKNKKKRTKALSGQSFIITVVLVVSICTAASGVKIQKKLEKCEEKSRTYKALIREEKGRKEMIENLDFYLGTKNFVEKTAREKFGLVYPDETVYQEKG